MRKLALGMMAAVLLAGCGTAAGDRGLSGAGIGAGIGIIGGPPGMVVGAAAGAVTGLVMPPSKVNLGRPAWQR